MCAPSAEVFFMTFTSPLKTHAVTCIVISSDFIMLAIINICIEGLHGITMVNLHNYGILIFEYGILSFRLKTFTQSFISLF